VTTYSLQSGDTLSRIANRFGVTVNNLLAANGLTAQDATRLQIGQSLMIPAPGQSFPTPTPAPATATPGPVQPSPTPAPTKPLALRLSAPVLLSPSSGTPILGCDTLQLLTWQASSLQPGDEYELYVGYLSGPPQADGSETISWAAVVRQTQSSWKLDTALCTQAPQEYNRQWRWYVQVINGSADVSPPSSINKFSWNP
jgi:LysM repeat protein